MPDSRGDRNRGVECVGIYNRSSRFSLTFYFLHYLIIGWPLAVVHLVSGRNPHGGLMGIAPALACGVAGLVFLELLLFAWERHGSKYSLEWFLGSLTRRFGGRREMP